MELQPNETIKVGDTLHWKDGEELVTENHWAIGKTPAGISDRFQSLQKVTKENYETQE